MKVTVSNEPVHLEIKHRSHMENVATSLVLSDYTVTIRMIRNPCPNQVCSDHFEIDAFKETEIEMEDKT